MERYSLDLSACSPENLPRWMLDNELECLPLRASTTPGFYEFIEQDLPLVARAIIAAEKERAGLLPDAPVYFTPIELPEGARVIRREREPEPGRPVLRLVQGGAA